MAIIRYRDGNGKVIPLYCIKGDNGNQMYVRFSAYADGTDMSEKWDAERNFMGIAFAYETPTEKEQYQWISLADISLGHYAEEGSEDKYLFFVGNGTGEDNRSNALTLDAEGVMWLLKDLLIGEDRVSVAETFDSFEKRFEAVEKKEADFEKSFWWNVDKNVGVISPSIDGERVSVSNSGFNTSIGTEESVSGQMSIPMINSGKLYLDFKTKTACKRDEWVGSYTVTDNVDIYVNEELVQTFGRVYTAESGGDFSISTDTDTIDTEYRHLLSVRAGDVVALKYTLTVRRKGGANYDEATAYLTVADIQLKANIATAHTYHTLEVES